MIDDKPPIQEWEITETIVTMTEIHLLRANHMYSAMYPNRSKSITIIVREHQIGTTWYRWVYQNCSSFTHNRNLDYMTQVLSNGNWCRYASGENPYIGFKHPSSEYEAHRVLFDERQKRS